MASIQHDTNLTISVYWTTFLTNAESKCLKKRVFCFFVFVFSWLHKRLAFNALATNHQ